MISYRILPEHRLIVFCFKGTTEPSEVLSMSNDLWADPEFSDTYDTIVDDSFLEHALTGQQVRELVERPLPQMSPGSRLAVIAPADATYGVSRMHQLLSEYRSPLKIEIFRDRDSALAWLGRDGLDIEDICKQLARGQ